MFRLGLSKPRDSCNMKATKIHIKYQFLFKEWEFEDLLGHYAPGNLHLKLICAVRSPRIWTDCIEVSWWREESPAANLSSFFQHHLCKKIYCSLGETQINIAFFYKFIYFLIKEPIVLYARNVNWCVKARGVRVTKICWTYFLCICLLPFLFF